ncbi:hypothetical protein FRACA_4470002 [Frankia canadensis]|uniref:Uncharacterized protein n=1 Tax=Frankia canadensis TaxID=1836972 RepID=A0A2I2KXI4_9ACTN|nr:hypothetical protein [Frankia canadensis]SNQ50366.1 hypothetical protein FRACA_4470002 [Frankia canadensis]SOU57656.1 hypothetical protein FRACA_4470002 [Frankia canadensis]
MSSGTDTWQTPSPDQVATYVRASGWQELHANSDTAIYVKSVPSGTVHQIFVPLSTRFADYDRGMRAVVVQIAASEGRDPAATALALSSDRTDHVMVGAESPEPGVIAIHEGAALFEGARAILQAAAESAVRAASRAVFTSSLVDAYLGTVRARVIPGSFVVDLACPLTPPLTGVGAQADNAFGRRVTTAVVDGVKAATRAALIAGEYADDSQLYNMLDMGMTAGFVEAVATIAPPEGATARRVAVDFARSLPVDQGLSMREIEVPPGIAGILRFAAERMRAAHPGVDPVYSSTGSARMSRSSDSASLSRGIIVGTVVSLDREDPSAARTARVRGRLSLPGEAERIVTVKINDRQIDYGQLIRAFNEGWQVAIEGDLLRRPRLSVFTRVSSIRML